MKTSFSIANIFDMKCKHFRTAHRTVLCGVRKRRADRRNFTLLYIMYICVSGTQTCQNIKESDCKHGETGKTRQNDKTELLENSRAYRYAEPHRGADRVLQVVCKRRTPGGAERCFPAGGLFRQPQYRIHRLQTRGQPQVLRRGVQGERRQLRRSP